MDLYKNFELYKGKFYLRDEVEGFRNFVLKKFHETQTKQEFDSKIVEQVTNILEEFGLYCNDPYQLPTVLKEHLKYNEVIEKLKKELAEYKEREDLIQKSILSAQKIANEILDNAHLEEKIIIQNAKLKENEISEKIDFYLNQIVKEQASKVEKVNQEIDLIKQEMVAFLTERLEMFNNDMALETLKEMASTINNDIYDIKKNIMSNNNEDKFSTNKSSDFISSEEIVSNFDAEDFGDLD